MLGFLIVDKPKGITSHEVVKLVRNKIKEKVGHCGTLDPLATGILILSLGKATRLSEYLLKQDKCYVVKGLFGYKSDTYDVDGKLEKLECEKIPLESLKSALDKFKGKIKQVPPPFSAVRVGGVRAYQLAREGKEVVLPEREVYIYALKLLEYEYPEFTLEICCSSGTYIRSLVYDLGKALNCSAVVSELRRTKVGKVTVDCAVPLSYLLDKGVEKFMISPEKILPFPTFSLTSPQFEKFKNGANLKVNLEEGFYSILFKNRFVGVGKVTRGILKPEKVII